MATNLGMGGGFGAPAGAGTYNGALDPNAFANAQKSGMSQNDIYGWALGQGMNAQQAAASGGNQQDYANYLAGNYKAQGGQSDAASLNGAANVGRQWGFNDDQIYKAGTSAFGAPAGNTAYNGPAPQSATNPIGYNETAGQGMPANTGTAPTTPYQNSGYGFGGNTGGNNSTVAAGQNPYLQQQADNITRNATQNFQNNIAPGLNGGAQLAGQYGGSRQGIAQGLAVKNLNQDITGQLSNLYGGAYESDANRAMQKYIADQQNATTQSGLGLQQQSINNQFTLGQGQLGVSQGQLALGNRTADQQYSLGSQSNANQLLGLNNQFALGTQANNIQQQGVSNQYALGSQANANQLLGLNNQFTLGNQANNIQQQGVNNQFTLGNQANQNQLLATNNAFTLGNQANQTQRYGIDQNTALGTLQSNNSLQGSLAGAAATTQAAASSAGASMYGSNIQGEIGRLNAANNSTANANSYNLGLGNLGLNQNTLNFNQNIAGATLARQNSQDVLAGLTQLQNLGYNVNNMDTNQVHQLLVNYGIINPSTGASSTSTQTQDPSTVSKLAGVAPLVSSGLDFLNNSSWAGF